MSSTVPAASSGSPHGKPAAGGPSAPSEEDFDRLPDNTARRYRLPWVAIMLPLALVLVTGPLAATGGALTLLWLVPLLALVWVLVTRTVATPEGLTVTGWRGLRRISWDGLLLQRDGQRWVVAAEPDGRRTRLPMVTAVDLPTLVGLSDERATVVNGPLPPAPSRRR